MNALRGKPSWCLHRPANIQPHITICTTRAPLLTRSNRKSLSLKAFSETSSIIAPVLGSLADVGQDAGTFIEEQLQTLSPLTFVALLGAGLATSLSPCTLSVLPLTIGYIGGYQSGGGQERENSDGEIIDEQPPLSLRALSFSLGLASTLALLGVLSTSLGKAYGQLGGGDTIPVVVSIIAIVMGLNLLEVIVLQLPSLDVDVREAKAPPLVTAYLAGLTFALAASPCSTPVLATVLAYVTTLDDPILGGALLLSYTTGYVAPLLFAATATEALTKVMSVREQAAWITPASGAMLIAGGSYTIASRLL